jgi:hypothetical protein
MYPYPFDTNMSINEKKERVRISLRILGDPAASPTALQEALGKVTGAICVGFHDNSNDAGVFATDKDFKEEVFSAQIVCDLLTAVKIAKGGANGDHLHFLCGKVCVTLLQLPQDAPELVNAPFANGGVNFVMEAMETYPSDESLVLACLGIFLLVFRSNLFPPEALALAVLEKTLDAMEAHPNTSDDIFGFLCRVLYIYHDKEYKKMRFEDLTGVVRFLCHGITKHQHDSEHQLMGRGLLGCLVGGDEKAQQMIDSQDDENEDCAACA